MDDIDKEYEAIIKISKNKNRFENIDKRVSFDRMALFYTQSDNIMSINIIKLRKNKITKVLENKRKNA